MFKGITQDRRESTETEYAEGLKISLLGALGELKAYGVLQKTGIVQEVGPVDDLVREMSDVILELQRRGESIPLIDVTGIPEEFEVCFDCHEGTAAIYRLLEQQRMKIELVSKWGTREERERRRIGTRQH